MFEGAPHRTFRLGHTLAVFGIFLSFITLTLSTVNSPRTIAFGTAEVAALSNQYRLNAGLAELTTNGVLTSSAQSKANHMATNNYFAHDAPDGTSPWYFFDQAGYAYSTAGENLALTNQAASSVVDGWYNSPGHRANMLSADFTEVGYGISFVPSFTYNGVTYANVYLVAAHYAKPIVMATAPATPTANPTPEPTANSSASPTSTTSTSSSNQETTNQSDANANAQDASLSGEAIAQDESSSNTDHPPVSGSTDENGNNTSGTMAVANTARPKISTPLAYGGIGAGSVLIVIGSAIETRRLLKHLPLLPHLR